MRSSGACASRQKGSQRHRRSRFRFPENQPERTSLGGSGAAGAPVPTCAKP